MELSRITRAESDNWYVNTPTSIRPATGRINVALISYPMRHFGLGRQHGHPVLPTDSLLRERRHRLSCILYRVSWIRDRDRRYQIDSTVKDRVVQRSRAIPRAADVIWADALGQVSRCGRATSSYRRHGRFADGPETRVDLVSRPLSFQRGKVRDIGDLKHGSRNDFS